MKIYHTATREDYDALMVELESQGFKWPNGEKPTEQFNYEEYTSETTITTYAYSDIIRYSSVKDDMEFSPDEPIIEYKSKGDNQMANKECNQCKKKWHQDSAKYCSWCGKKLVEELEFKSGDVVASQVFSDGSFSFVQLNEDLTNQFTSVDGFWYIKRDCAVRDESLVVFIEDTRHATPEEIAEYEVALTFHEHGREPFEIKEGDILSDSENIFFVNEDIEIWNKEDFISGDFTFLKTAEEVNEWLENK